MLCLFTGQQGMTMSANDISLPFSLSFFFSFQGRFLLGNGTVKLAADAAAVFQIPFPAPLCARVWDRSREQLTWLCDSDEPSEAFCSVLHTCSLQWASTICRVSRRLWALLTGKDLNISCIRCTAFSSTLPHICPCWQLYYIVHKMLIGKALVANTALVQISK